MTFIDCTAVLVGQLNGNGQKGMLQIDAPLTKISCLGGVGGVYGTPPPKIVKNFFTQLQKL